LGNVRARELLGLAIRRLSPGDHFVGDAAAEIAMLREAAEPGSSRYRAGRDHEGQCRAAGSKLGKGRTKDWHT
jgi:hypothetical protein